MLKLPKDFLLLLGAFILVMSASIYLLLGQRASAILVEQMLHRETLAARAGAGSLSIFMELFKKSLVLLSDTDEIRSVNGQTEKALDNFITKWEGSPVGGVIFLDVNGKVHYNGNRVHAPEIGTDLSDRKYFEWSKSAGGGEVFVSEPVVSRLGASRDRQIVTVTTPVIDNAGTYRGALAASVIIEELNDTYLDPLKISEKTRIYLINDEGVIVSSSFHKLVGVNYLNYIRESKIAGSERIYEILSSNLNQGKEGKIDIALPDEEKGGRGLTRFLIAYAPLSMGETTFTLAVATPVEDALVFLTPIYLRAVAVVGLAFLALFIIAVRVAKSGGYQEAVADEHKIHKIKDV